jgi:hypothetical protein
MFFMRTPVKGRAVLREVSPYLHNVPNPVETEHAPSSVKSNTSEFPDRLRSRQWVDLFAKNGFGKLRRAMDREIVASKKAIELLSKRLLKLVNIIARLLDDFDTIRNLYLDHPDSQRWHTIGFEYLRQVDLAPE